MEHKVSVHRSTYYLDFPPQGLNTDRWPHTLSLLLQIDVGAGILTFYVVFSLKEHSSVSPQRKWCIWMICLH